MTHDGATTGPYATKEAAFAATADAASIAMRDGHAIEISAPAVKRIGSRRCNKGSLRASGGALALLLSAHHPRTSDQPSGRSFWRTVRLRALALLRIDLNRHAVFGRSSVAAFLRAIRSAMVFEVVHSQAGALRQKWKGASFARPWSRLNRGVIGPRLPVAPVGLYRTVRRRRTR